MGDTRRTEREYVAVVSKVLEYIQANLGADLTPRELSDVAAFSPHHFHRIFRAVVGESVMDHVRRLRMEQAAYRLRSTGLAVGEVAVEAGYSAHESFTRIFEAYFGMAPQQYRASPVSHMVPAACGVHFSPPGFTSLHPRLDRDLLQTDGLCAAHREHAPEFEESWERLLEFVRSFGSAIYPRSFRYPSNGALDAAGELTYMTTQTTDIDTEISDLEQEMLKAKERLTEARRRRPPEEVQDYVLKDQEGRDVRLSELFGDKEDLIVVHNMGTGCSYCTMWADGFTGLVPHLSDRAAFVVISPDKPDVQKRFAEKRSWNFRMASIDGTTFNQDLGFFKDDGHWPGVSTFRRGEDGKIYRIAKSFFGPGDDFCAVWPFLDMLEGGPKDWAPKYTYKP